MEQWEGLTGPRGVGDRAPAVAPTTPLSLVSGATIVAVALTESFEVLPAALAAYASAYLLLRGD